MELDIAARFDRIEADVKQILKLLGKSDGYWQICDRPITRMEFEYWPNTKPDGTFDVPGFGLKLAQSGIKKVDVYKQLYGKDVGHYDLTYFQELPVNAYLEFDWMNGQVAELRRKYKSHHIVFFHQYYINNSGMEEVFNNFLLVVDQNTLSGFALFRCINDKPIKMDLEFQAKEVNGKTRYMCVLSANQLKPVRTKIK